MDSVLTTVGLPLALGIMMFGLGLALTTDDFARVGRHPKAVAVALAGRLVLLPPLCFGLVVLFDLARVAGHRDDAARGLGGRNHGQPAQSPLQR